jgi:ceramide glucosyltransferase
VILHGILATLAFLSLALTLWQWLAARRFPLHARVADSSFAPPVTLLKPLKGCDDATGTCLRSWFAQEYAGEIQILFGIANETDPARAVVNLLIREFPQRDAQLVVCGERLGANAKVSQLAQLQSRAKHDILVVSDADVCVPPDFLANLVSPLREQGAGLVSCFYQLANPSTPALHWEAIATNADFWSMVLQGASLGKLDFALGAVMATRRRLLDEIGGFRALMDCLADDYQLGNRIARRGHRIELCPVVVECRSAPMGWGAVWKHQLRWARTIRVCQPAPYFFSIVANASLWPLIWLATSPDARTTAAVAVCLLIRMATAANLERRLTRTPAALKHLWFVPLKDILQAALWACAFAGNHIEWRGERYRLRRDGTLEAEPKSRG